MKQALHPGFVPGAPDEELRAWSRIHDHTHYGTFYYLTAPLPYKQVSRSDPAAFAGLWYNMQTQVYLWVGGVRQASGPVPPLLNGITQLQGLACKLPLHGCLSATLQCLPWTDCVARRQHKASALEGQVGPANIVLALAGLLPLNFDLQLSAP